MLENLRADARKLKDKGDRSLAFYVIEAALFDNGFQAVLLHRLAACLKGWHIPVLPAWIARYNIFSTGVDINPAARIGPGLRISHGVGIVVGGAAVIGADAILLHQVTIGSISQSRVAEMPTVGDRVFLAAGCKLIGKITLGDDVAIGPNAVVTQDVPSGCRVRTTAGIEIVPRSGN
jgi:serine O-acetyltransferase